MASSAFAQATKGGAGGAGAVGTGAGNGGTSSTTGNGGDGGAEAGTFGGGGGGAGAIGGAGGSAANGAVAGGGAGAANGGDGSSGNSGGGTNSGSGGGGGGHGSIVTVDTTNAATITGGRGGVGGASNASNRNGGGGGAGGYGVVVNGSGLTYTNANNGSIAGRAGGAGGADTFGSGGFGGGGGHGVLLTGSGTLLNSGTITSGNGGNGGNGDALTGKGGGGGNGGIGVVFTAASTLNNSGSITGGAGGNAGAGSTQASTGFAGVGVSGSDLTIINSGSISGGLGADGSTRANAITFTGGANTLTLQSGWSLTGNIDVTGSLTFNQSIAATLANVISGAGSVIHSGTGTLTLSGSNTYTGATTVNGGILSVNGDITPSSGVTVNSGGTLGGTGQLPAVVINNGGTLAPGNSIGTVTVNGNLTFNAGSTYAVEVSPSSADKTIVTGTASLTGATVQATYQAGSYLTKRYTILSSAGLGGTTFAGLINISLPAGFSATLDYTTTDVLLNLTASISPISSLPPNQQGPANSIINYFNNGGSLPSGFVTLVGLTGAAQQSGYAQVSGEGNATAMQSSYSAATQFVNTMLDHAIEWDGGGGASAFAGEAPAEALRSAAAREAYAAVTPRDKRETFAARWSLWATGYGGSSSVTGDTTQGTHSTLSRIYGAVAGANYRFTPDTLVGFALGGGGFNFSTAEGLGTGRGDMAQAGLFARHAMGNAYLSAALAYGWQRVNTDRTVTVAGTDRLEATFNAQTVAARGEVGYRFAMPWLALTPYAAVQFTELWLPAYSQAATSGSNQFALAYASQTANNTRSELGLRADKAFALGDSLLTVRGRAAWTHDNNNDRPLTPIFQALPGSQSFTVSGARAAADGALTVASAEIRLANGWAAAGIFEGEFSRTTKAYAGKGTVTYSW